MSILVRNGLVLKDGAFKKLDVYIDGDRIEKIGGSPCYCGQNDRSRRACRTSRFCGYALSLKRAGV